MQAVFYSFSKRKNSTALPSGAGETFDITLKNGCSFLSPTFLLSAETFNYNYCQFNGRYYWVTDITSVRNNLFEVRCSVDVLASWKNDIMATTAFVEYSSSDTDQYILDNRNVVSTEVERSFSSYNFPLFDIVGCYVLCTMSYSGSTTFNESFATMYAMNAGQLGAISQEFNDPTALEAISQFFSNPTETVIFCRWLPIPIPSDTPLVNVKFGNYESSIQGNLVIHNYVDELGSIEIPWQKSDFRNAEPYTTASIYLPGVGNCQIPLSSIINVGYIDIHCVIDYVTNAVHYQLTAGPGAAVIGNYSGSIGVDIPVNAVQSGNIGGILGGLGTLAGGALSLITGGVSLAGSTAVAGGLATLGAASMSQNIGVSGGFSGGYNVKAGGTSVYLQLIRKLSIQEPSGYVATIGNPCMKTRQISGLSGYCQTNSFQVGGAMTETEKSQINSMMDGGVYIE